MNAAQRRITGYALAGIAVLLIFVLLGWYGLRETPTEPPTTEPERSKPEPQHATRSIFRPDELPTETPVSQPEASATTNAATLYRQAFALFDALPRGDKDLLGDWRTNVDASVEAELCQRIRPICGLMHEATAVTNCDWGIEPLTFETRLPFLAPVRNLARAAVWSATHCRADDSTRAMDDVLSALRLGQHVSQAAVIGCLVHFAIQGLAFSSVASSLRSFRGTDGQRLATAVDDPYCAQASTRAMEKEAAMVDQLATRLASLPAEEAEKEVAAMGDGRPKLTQSDAVALLKQVADSERQLAKALASGSEAEYQTWIRDSEELQKSNPLAKLLLATYGRVADNVQHVAISRVMMITALAVVEAGPDAVLSFPDPATGQPFTYTETADGFELQSGYEFTNGVPVKMQFK